MQVRAEESRDLNDIRGERTTAPVESRRRVLVDVVVVLLATVAMAYVSSRLELGEAFFHWTRRFENLQFDELPPVLLVLTTGFMWFALRRYRETGIVMTRQRAIDARLHALLLENRDLARQNVTAQETERSSIARELHDEMGQYLNAIKIDAIAIRDSTIRESNGATPDRVRDAAVAVVRNADHVYAVIGDLIRRLRPAGLDELGLIAALENCIEHWRPRLPNVRLSFSASGDFSRLTEHANLALFRVVQEALTNVAKHAQAHNVTVDLRNDASDAKQTVELRIGDDGLGADLRSSTARLAGHADFGFGLTGFGLISMRERVEMHGGRFEIDTAPGRGFVIRVRVPE